MRILVADIGGTSIKIGLCNEKGHFYTIKEYATKVSGSKMTIMERLIHIISEFHDFDAIGISTAGQVNSDEGYIIYANENIPNYTGTRIKDILEQRFNVPVQVENDVNAAALGERYFGIAKEYSDFLCLTFGTGIGGAIVLESKIYKGITGVAGEFGHIITHPYGHKCPCGSNGCYETYASTTALVKAAKAINEKYSNGRIIFESIHHGDNDLIQVIKDWVFEVALGLTSLIHIFNPPAIIIGGGVMEQEMLVEMISRQVKDLVMDSFSDVLILKASLGNKAGMLGALSLHLNK